MLALAASQCSFLTGYMSLKSLNMPNTNGSSTHLLVLMQSHIHTHTQDKITPLWTHYFTNTLTYCLESLTISSDHTLTHSLTHSHTLPPSLTPHSPPIPPSHSVQSQLFGSPTRSLIITIYYKYQSLEPQQRA